MVIEKLEEIRRAHSAAVAVPFLTRVRFTPPGISSGTGMITLSLWTLCAVWRQRGFLEGFHFSTSATARRASAARGLHD
jgi:hypothetical protein